MFADTFNRYFEPENLHAAEAVLAAAGYQTVHVTAPRGTRPLCCGRTFLSVGLVNKARAEMQRSLDALRPYLEQGVPVVGLEPSCLLTFRDELQAVLPGKASAQLGRQSFLFEEFVTAEGKGGAFASLFSPLETNVHLHTHCHQKAFNIGGSVEACLGLVPGLGMTTIDSSCCGMAGSFGYKADTIAVSKAMGELTLLPAVRKVSPDAIIAADGFSCRHQIRDGTGREALHVARILAAALPDPHKQLLE